MKRWSTVIYCLMMISLVVSCQPSAGVQTDTPTPKEPEPTDIPTPIPCVLRSVAIFVVDSFNPDATLVPAKQLDCREQPCLCLAYPDGQLFCAGGGMSGGCGSSLPAGTTHGDLVYGQISDFLSGRFGPMQGETAPQPQDPIWKYAVWQIQGQQSQILLVAIDTEGYTSEVIADRLARAVTLLSSECKYLNGIVVNMSFGLVPCEDETLLVKKEGTQLIVNDLSLDEYIQALETQANTTQDPLYQWLIGAQSIPIINVAAAGNQGYDFPLAPALYPNVLGVSATPCPTGTVYSNAGEVQMAGQYTYPGGIVYGTSFAAPELSCLAALYLVYGGQVPCQGIMPPFNYVDQPTPGAWHDLPLPAAAATYCPGFPTH